MLLSLILSGNFNFFSVITCIAASLLVILFVLPFHEYAHGFVAYKLGDRTAKNSGRLTLNPLAHLDYAGALLLMFIGFGWAKPVPIDDRNFKNPKVGMAITALAGPIANLLAAIIAGLIYNAIIYTVGMAVILTNYFWYYTVLLFQYLMIINIGLAVFNLIPIPPLDGSKILMAFLPDRIVYKIYEYQQFFAIGLFVLVMMGGLSGGFISTIQNWLFVGINRLTALPFNL